MHFNFLQCFPEYSANHDNNVSYVLNYLKLMLSCSIDLGRHEYI